MPSAFSLRLGRHPSFLGSVIFVIIAVFVLSAIVFDTIICPHRTYCIVDPDCLAERPHCIMEGGIGTCHTDWCNAAVPATRRWGNAFFKILFTPLDPSTKRQDAPTIITPSASD